MSSKLFVGNISWGVDQGQLKEAFEQAGEVISATIITDKFNGRSKGFGFVEMSSPEEASQAIDMWNEKELDGRPLTVNEAKPKR